MASLSSTTTCQLSLALNPICLHSKTDPVVPNNVETPPTSIIYSNVPSTFRADISNQLFFRYLDTALATEMFIPGPSRKVLVNLSRFYLVWWAIVILPIVLFTHQMRTSLTCDKLSPRRSSMDTTMYEPFISLVVQGGR